MRAPTAEDEAVWHDVECAAYAADLPLWRELAAASAGPVLDIGCGTGRVALDLAARGVAVVGLDSHPDLVAEFAARAKARSVPVEAVAADARSFELGRTFGLAIVPMQVVQLLGGERGRAGLLAAARRHLTPGGRFALALADPFEAVPAAEALPPLPDVLERDGWVLSSSPVAVRAVDGAVAIDRLRQAVSPAGELTEGLVTLTLDDCAPEQLESEAQAAGFAPVERHAVAPTDDHVGSTIVVLDARSE